VRLLADSNIVAQAVRAMRAAGHVVYVGERTVDPGDHPLLAAYRRDDLFQKRRQLAEAWAKFCAAPSIGELDEVIVAAVWTRRARDICRIISVRKARDEEKRHYREIYG
jgi:hypothetical protein